MKFKEGKVIEILYVEKNGKKTPVIIRYPKKSDVKEVWRFYNKVIKETENLSRISPVSLKDERKWIYDVIAILQEFTGLGLGTKMMTNLEKHIISGLKILMLDVYEKNKIAQNLYKKMGFKSIGAVPYSVKTKKCFESGIIMYKVLK